MLEALPEAAFSVLASSHTLKRVASRYGMRRSGSFARRFIAGETVDEAIAVAERIERAGMLVTLDHLGESVSSSAGAADATRAYLAIINDVERAGVCRNLSVKLTQLGIDVDRATLVDNVRRLLDVAVDAGFFIRIDMERSTHTEQTLDTFETLWTIGYRNVGIVLQSCLHRSAGDVRRMNTLGARVRLVKGAYNEPATVAFQQKSEVDTAFVELSHELLQQGTYPAIATHDPAMIAAARTFANAHGIKPSQYEFQMLYGIRRDLQAQLAAESHPVRIYVPFGREWFPYFMRRLGERPANVGFVVRSLFKETH